MNKGRPRKITGLGWPLVFSFSYLSQICLLHDLVSGPTSLLPSLRPPCLPFIGRVEIKHVTGEEMNHFGIIYTKTYLLDFSVCGNTVQLLNMDK